MNHIISNSISTSRATYYRQVIYVGLFFFIFGFVTWINGALIPYLRIACQLNEIQSYLVTFAFYISYTLMAIPATYIIKKMRMLGAMELGLYIMALGCLQFIPAAYYREYGLFLIGLFCIGIGLTILQAAVNPFITLLGSSQSATQRISIMSACNKFAGLLAPLIFSYLILKDSNDLPAKIANTATTELDAVLDSLAHKVIVPYAVLAFLLVIIAFTLKYSILAKVKPTNEEDLSENKLNSSVNLKTQLSLGFVAIFCCVGAEVVAGDTISSYAISQNFEWHIAKNLTSLTLLCMLIGCILSALIVPRYLSYQKAFLISTILGLLIIVSIITISSPKTVYGVAFLGFANAILWPAIWPQALKNLTGKNLRTASAVLVMGIAGGAIMPLIYGWISSHLGNQLGYIVLIPCYIYLIFYWYSGKIK